MSRTDQNGRQLSLAADFVARIEITYCQTQLMLQKALHSEIIFLFFKVLMIYLKVLINSLGSKRKDKVYN